MILCSKLKKDLCKTVTKSQVVTKSRLHCNRDGSPQTHKKQKTIHNAISQIQTDYLLIWIRNNSVKIKTVHKKTHNFCH